MLDELFAKAQELAASGQHITSACNNVAFDLSLDDLKALETEINSARYSKMLARSENAEMTPKDRQYWQASAARFIASTLEVKAR